MISAIESNIRLPYHQPEKKGICDFLAKARQKQESFQHVKAQGVQWKHAPDVLSDKSNDNTSVDIGTLSNPIALPSIEENQSVLTSKDLNNCVEPGNMAIESKDIAKNSRKLDLDENELPDLVIETVSDKENGQFSDTCQLADEATLNDSPIINVDTLNAEELLMDSNIIGTSEEQVERTGVIFQKVTGKDDKNKPEHDSGYLTTPAHSSEEENSADSLATTPTKNQDENKEGAVTPNQTVSSESNTPLTPKLAELDVKSKAPRLSGGAEDFIDFDHEDNSSDTPMNSTGVEKLMERFMKHSHNKKKGKGKDIEIRYEHFLRNAFLTVFPHV